MDLLNALDFNEGMDEDFWSEFQVKDIDEHKENSAEANPPTNTTLEAAQTKKRSSSEDREDEPSKKQKTDIESNVTEDKTCETSTSGLNPTPKELPFFDFFYKCTFQREGKYIHVEDWLKDVEHIKTVNNWSDTKTKCEILNMMTNAQKVRSWLSSLSEALTWEEWRDKLLYSFPEKDDYHTNIIRVFRWKKKASETYESYFNNKLALLEHMNMTAEQAVSCLVGGILDVAITCAARSGRYKTPAELLEFFKLCDEKEREKIATLDTTTDKPKEQPSNESCAYPIKKLVVLLENKDLMQTKTALNNSEKKKEDTSNQKCSCCDQKGHTSLNCPLIKTTKTPGKSEKSIIIHDNKVIMSATPQKSGQGAKCACCDKPGHSSLDCPLIRSNQDAPSAEKSSTSITTKCSFCDNEGHSSLVCPLIDVNKDTPRRGNIKIRLDKDRLEKGKLSDQAFKISADDDFTVISDKEEKNQTQKKVEQKKCSCCDKVGHTSADCPLVKTNKAADQSQKKNVPQAPRKCSSCDKVGHLRANCPLVSNKKSISANSVQVQKKTPRSNPKCASCDKVGHSSMDCPLLGNNKKSSTSSASKVEEKQSQNKVAGRSTQKCASCDKVGHSSMDCPLLGSNRKSNTGSVSKVAEKEPQNKTKGQSTQKCTNCDKVGHSKMDCPLLSSNKKSNTSSSSKAEEKQSQNKASGQSTQKCASCNKVGHSSVDCPLISSNKKSNISSSSKAEEKQSQNKVQSTQKCSSCDKLGHSSMNCPLLGNNKNSKASAVSSNKASVEEKRPQNKTTADSSRKCSCCGKFGHSSVDCRLREINKSTKPATDKAEEKQPQKKTTSQSTQKCSSCDKVGHSSMNCPLLAINKKTNASSVSNDKSKVESKSQNKTTSQSTKKCSSCDKEGHPSANCPLLGFIQKTYDGSTSRDKSKVEERNGQKKSSSQSTKKCSSCDKIGHSSLDCPLLAFKKNANTSSSSNAKSRVEESKSHTKTAAHSTQKCSGCDKSGHSAVNCPLLGLNRNTNASLTSGVVFESVQRCSSCNKLGHLSIKCPILMPNKSGSGSKNTFTDDDSVRRGAETAPQKNTSAQTFQKCSSCNNVGHSIRECPFASTNRSAATRHDPNTQETPLQNCPRCGKEGHSMTNCLLSEIYKNTNISIEKKKHGSRSVRRCLCCNEVGHPSLECPLLEVNQKTEKCAFCSKTEHTTQSCPFYGFFTGAKDAPNPAIQEVKEKFRTSFVKAQESYDPRNPSLSPPRRSYETFEEQPPQKRYREELREKCHFCGETDHTSVECFQKRFEQARVDPRPKSPVLADVYECLLSSDEYHQRSENRSSHLQSASSMDVLQCEFCKRVGHRISECFFAKFDKNIYEAHYGASGSSVGRQCLFCGKFGHLQPDCPKNKGAKRISFSVGRSARK